VTDRQRDVIVALVGVALYFALGTVTQEERAFATALSAYVFYVIVTAEWQFKCERRFWLVIGTFAVLHIVALSTLPFPHYAGPSIIALPLALLDGFVMWIILKWVERPGESSPD
jgi:hypothetical protein